MDVARALLVPLALSIGAPGLAAEPLRFTVALEARQDRFRYHFENPSSFDTVALVPHEFTQTYAGDNTWAVARARYRAFGHAWESEVALTPERTMRGDDFDRFFQPGGDRVVIGTTGDVRMRSLRLVQTVDLADVSGFVLRVGYRYWRDRSDFQPGIYRVTHTSPASATVQPSSGHETTISEVHEVRVGVSRRGRMGPRWRIEASTDVAPTARARLTTRLPDKYPGQDIVFDTLGLAVSSRVAFVRSGRWPIELALDYSRTFSYLADGAFRRSALGVSVGIAGESARGRARIRPRGRKHGRAAIHASIDAPPRAAVAP
jgi:hypothetical protein